MREIPDWVICYSVCNQNIILGKGIQLSSFLQKITVSPPFHQRRYHIINNTEIIKKCKSISKGLMSCSSFNTLCYAFIHTNFPGLRLQLTTQYMVKHRTNIDTPMPSSDSCSFSNIHMREKSSSLNMSAVSSSSAAVWLQTRRRRKICHHHAAESKQTIWSTTTELHFVLFFILPHSARQQGIWCSPWRS